MRKKLKKNIPKLRFPEFKDGWKEKKLDQLIQIKSGYAFSSRFFSTNETDKILLTPGNFHVNGGLYFGSNTKYYEGEVTKEYILSNGDLLIVMTDLTKEMNILGNSIFLESAKIVLHNQRIGKILIKEDLLVTRCFLRDVLNLDICKENIRKSATGSTVRHTSNKSILSIEIFIPSIAEQKKIASFLGAIDKRLTQLRRKHKLLQTYKRGVMQKIFSQEVRFKGAIELAFPDWEKKKLSEISNKISDGIHSTPKYDENGEYYFINGNNLIDTKIEFDENTKRVDKSEYLKHKNELTSQTILISINGTIGNLAFYNNEKIVLGKSACYIDLKSEENKFFVFYFLQTSSIRTHFNKELTGSTIKNLSLTTIKNTKALFPSHKEQEKIADFLTAIDQKIEAVARQIDRTEQFKKGLLQKMFV